MKNWLYLINDFSHDLFTGLWLACFYVLFRLQFLTTSPHLSSLQKEFFFLQSGAMACIVITGIVRAVHVKSGASPAPLEVRKTILIIKHIVMGLLFVAGTILSFSWRY